MSHDLGLGIKWVRHESHHGPQNFAPCVKRSGMIASQAVHEVRQLASVATELSASKTIFPLLRPDGQIEDELRNAKGRGAEPIIPLLFPWATGE